MAIKIVVSDTVRFGVKGVIRGATGADEPFGFNLTCKRLDSEEIQSRLRAQEDQPLTDFFAEIVLDWSGVQSETGQPLPYSVENLRALFRIPGTAALAFRTYLSEVGAKEKN